MNHDEFESRLQRTPLKQPPPEWREQILTAASPVAADVNRRTSPIRELTFAATWQRRLRELFWPHPIAWGAMAAVWVAIGAVHLALLEPRQPTAHIHVAISSDMPTLMVMQWELLASWDEPAHKPKPPPTAPIPPQSCIDRRREFLEA